MHLYKKLSAGVVAFLAVSSSFAQGFYVGADAGYARIEAAEEAAQLLANAAQSTVTYQDGVALGRIFGGYRLAPFAAVEVGGFHSSDLEFDIAGAQNLNVSLSSKGIDFSVLLNTTGAGAFDNFFVRAGGHYSSAEFEFNGPGNVGLSSSEDGGGYLLGVGYDVPFGNAFSARLGYTRYGQIAGDEDLDADYFAVGLKYSF